MLPDITGSGEDVDAGSGEEAKLGIRWGKVGGLFVGEVVLGIAGVFNPNIILGGVFAVGGLRIALDFVHAVDFVHALVGLGVVVIARGVLVRFDGIGGQRWSR